MEDIFLKAVDNISVTEKGAQGYKSTFDPMVDFSFRLVSYRRKESKDIEEDFEKVLDSKNENVLRFLFYIRDIKNGLGERRTFRICLKKFAASEFQEKGKIIAHVCDYIMEYGRADDIFCLLDDDVDASVQDIAYDFIERTFMRDMIAFSKGENVTLLAKWLPSENASSKVTRRLAAKIRKRLSLAPKVYRKALRAMRSKLNIVERNMSANDWDKVDYNAVPSCANLAYKEAFMRHDGPRRSQYLSDLEKGKKGLKMNSSAVFPYDIVHKYMSKLGFEEKAGEEDATLELAWKNLKDASGLDSCLVVADGSWSMYSYVSLNSRVTAQDVAYSIAIYGAQHLKGEYNGKMITFSSTPRFLDISQKRSLKDILEYLEENGEVANTNIEAVFNLILGVAVSKNLRQEDLPRTILIISDMEFDECVVDADNDSIGRFNNPIEIAGERFERHGYKLPKLVFWNVGSRSNTVPILQNDLGVTLISGFTPNLYEGVALGECDSKAMLEKTLNGERYSKIEKIAFEEAKK